MLASMEGAVDCRSEFTIAINSAKIRKKANTSLDVSNISQNLDESILDDDNVTEDDAPEDFPTALEFLKHNVGPMEKAESIWRKHFAHTQNRNR